MCGIAAIITADIGKAPIGAMLDTQTTRGPERKDIWADADIVMGHNRLSLVDLGPTGDQPMEGERYVLTYNGEIYNHEELRGHCPNYRWKGSSDTETLLALIETFGVRAALPMLNGMWAFAVWDKRDRQLTVATDPFAIKPLYIYEGGSAGLQPGLFACASSSAALLHLQPKWEVDTAAVYRYFHLGGSDGLWEGIERMHGGEMVVWDCKEATTFNYTWYTPTYWEGATPELLTDLVKDAIRISAKADVPVGIFFSGGIDTSVIASALGAGAGPGAKSIQGAPVAPVPAPAPAPAPAPVPAFHLQSTELPFAQQGATHFGLDLHVVPIASEQVKALKDIAQKSGEPTMAGHIPWVVSQYAAEHVKACISGNGADELFFGYPRTATKPSEVAAMDAHLFRRTSAYTPAGRASGRWQECAPLTDPRFGFDAQQRWRELQFYIQHDLNPTLDAASMCHSLEVRVPFLDVRVVECALSMPYRVHGRKTILKKILADAGLPTAYYERDKLGFSMPNPGKEWDAYATQALAMAAKKYGFNLNGLRGYQEAGRDKGYLKAAAAGWRAWYETWQHLMA